MSEKSESTPASGASCIIPNGPEQGQSVPHGSEACFPEGTGGQDTIHVCQNGTWVNKGDACTPAPPSPEK